MMVFRWILTGFLLVALSFLPAGLTAAAESRIALVIGNGHYQTAPLKNPANDAADIAAALRGVGFEVTLKTDAGRRAMEDAIRNLGTRLKSGGVGLFYYAGHGFQYQGRNYLIPVDANIVSEADVKYEAVDAGRVLAQMEAAGNPLNIIILDACRNNPFARSFRSADLGLAKMDAPTGSILAYATAPGSVAADGTGRNGLYTEKLLAHLRTPGIDLPHFFMNVRKDVVAATGQRQVPWESSSLIGDFYFVPARGITVAAKAPVPASVQAPPVSAKSKFAVGISPQMVLISPGAFMMGSPTTEPGRMADEPRHHVTLTRGFYIQATEVTQGQWKAVMGDNPSEFNTCGDDCPVERVSWDDVQTFIRKLNASTGKHYRLPTEVEWEYAARAGTDTAFASGGITASGCDRDVNLDAMGWYCKDDGETHPVAMKQPNAWGLYDMHGNVSEWVQDWYSDYPATPVTDPTPKRAQGANARVLRGGSWYSQVGDCRSAFRDTEDPDKRRKDIGFRLAMDPS